MRFILRTTLAPAISAALLLLPGCHSSDRHDPTTAVAHTGSDYFSPTESPEVPLVSLPGEILLGPGQDTILVCQPELGRVVETEIATGRTRVVTTSPDTPWGVVAIPGSDRVLVVDPGRDALFLVDPATGVERSLLQPFPGTALEAACTADGSWCWVLLDRGYLVRLPLAGGQAHRIDPRLEDPWGLVLEAGGETALVCERTAGRVVRVRLDDASLQVLTESADRPTDLLIEPGGASALVAQEEGKIDRLDLLGGTLTPVAALEGATTLAAGRSAGEVLVADYVSGKLFALDPASGSAPILVEGLGEPTWLTVPDSSTLALVDQTGLGGIYRVDLAGATARPVLLLEDGSDLTSLAASPDGKDLLTATLDGKILRVPLDGSSWSTLATGLYSPGALCPWTTDRLYLAEHQESGGADYASLAELDLVTLQLTALTGFTIPYPVHGIVRGDATRLLVRDDRGLRTFDLVAGQLSPFYAVEADAVTGLAAAWPYGWVAWYDQGPGPRYRIYSFDFTRGSLNLVASGSGVQPVGLALSKDGLVLYAADLVAAAVVRFAP